MLKVDGENKAAKVLKNKIIKSKHAYEKKERKKYSGMFDRLSKASADEDKPQDKAEDAVAASDKPAEKAEPETQKQTSAL